MGGEKKDFSPPDIYQEWSDKGQVIDGRRITIVTGKTSYKVNESVRIAHVMEATQAGHELYVMGPKQIFDESVNGVPQGKSLPDEQADPFITHEYDGRVVDSPAIDFNYEQSVYTFAEPGEYEICWKPGKWRSNTLKITVVV